MTYDEKRRKHVVRWRDNGRRRIRRFDTREEAEVFECSLSAPASATDEAPGNPEVAALERRLADLEAKLAAAGGQPDAPGDGVFPYQTQGGTRYGFKFRQSDGTSSTRRGYTSRRAARAAKRELEESIRRGEVKVARESFEAFWKRFLADRRPYLVRGTYQNYEVQGRKRLLPHLGSRRLSAIDEELLRDEWWAEMVELVEAGELAPKTVNNTRTCLSVALGEAVRRKLLPSNPCESIKPLPVEKVEIDYLRMAEIDRYLDACPDHYRPLAELLIGTGARISEALAIRCADLELEHSVVRIYRQRAAHAAGDAPTKGKRFRSVIIGPRLVETLRDLKAQRQEHAVDGRDWLFLCPPVRRGRYSHRELAPPHRLTVHGWHEAVLEDAGLRDMPLHSLRHTAAAAWLATGHSLIFVQRQLGHASITTTEEHYGHLEVAFMHDAVARTEAKIREAGRLVPAAG
jgi:integrase